MNRTRFFRATAFAVAIPLALAACGKKSEADKKLDALDAELTDAKGSSKDPAVMGALHDQIMVDPALAHQANQDAVRPPARPYAGEVPPEAVAADGKAQPTPPPPPTAQQGQAALASVKHAPEPQGDCPDCKAKQVSVTLGGIASRQTDRRTASCANGLQYSATWAQRLPADLPLYPDARVSEAAGSTGNACALRVVSFASATPVNTLIDWYYTRATNAGYTAEHQADRRQHVLGGTRGRDGGAYMIYFTPRGDGGTDVDLVANNGR